MEGMYCIAGIDVHKKMLAVVVADVARFSTVRATFQVAEGGSAASSCTEGAVNGHSLARNKPTARACAENVYRVKHPIAPLHLL